jgi:uncharacterized membrane protein
MLAQWEIGYDWSLFVVLFAWLIILGITIWVSVYALLWRHAQRAAKKARFTPNERESLETLRRRYVHGDIGTDTFEQAHHYLDVPARSDDDLITTER